ncbi:MAG: hypothetical protein Q7J31_17805 [Syntrophales bacterium]|nr:hypothetical protein [Syntrophales bacterium]
MALRTFGYVALTLKFQQEGDKWTAFCEELGTATYAHTLAEAQVLIRETVACHLNTLEEVGERERFFKEHGIVLRTHKPKVMRFPTKGMTDRTFVQAYFPSVPIAACAAV